MFLCVLGYVCFCSNRRYCFLTHILQHVTNLHNSVCKSFFRARDQPYNCRVDENVPTQPQEMSPSYSPKCLSRPCVSQCHILTRRGGVRFSNFYQPHRCRFVSICVTLGRTASRSFPHLHHPGPGLGRLCPRWLGKHITLVGSEYARDWVLAPLEGNPMVRTAHK